MATRAGADRTARDTGDIVSWVHFEGVAATILSCSSPVRHWSGDVTVVALRGGGSVRSERIVARLFASLAFAAVMAGAVAWCAVAALWYILLLGHGLSGIG